MKKIEFYKAKRDLENGGVRYELSEGYLVNYVMDGGELFRIVYAKTDFGKWNATELSTGYAVVNCYEPRRKDAVKEVESRLPQLWKLYLDTPEEAKRIELWSAKGKITRRATA